ncbi:hypothetical protein BV25DRAFT_1821584 [Artomyces pyxidatus]|uniref:Uncharacterized protein n=1 Tax=Artomyces pyxidatus TaxID=48021 RepID=A0ACB8TBD1_9AGAM|nr:hypothetical protein BV25DRAFT_1821584 [Artomyces pyxidatus]
MNSLNYLSRQFDVLASRSVPSTPTHEHPPPGPSNLNSPSAVHRTPQPATWSLRSLVAPPPPPRRAISSPARIPTLRRRPSQRTAIRIKAASHPQGVLRRLFFVRVLVLLWNSMCAAAASLRPRNDWHGAVRDVKAEKEGEQPVLVLQASPEPEGSPGSPYHPPVVRTATDPPALDATPVPYSLQQQSSHPQSLLIQSLMIQQSLSSSPSISRTPTPSATGLPIAPRKTPFHLPKTLVLDLDETLIHSTSRPLPARAGLLGFGGQRGAQHTVEVVMGGRSTVYHVYKRPFVDFFLRKVSAWYTLVIFTASMQEYADPVIDWLDAGRGILERRLFRESCTQLPNGAYTKDLSVVEQDLARVCLIDNSPVSYSVNDMNGIPIEGWTHDPSDEALLDLLPVLDSLRFTSDVRRVLGIRGYS